MSLNDVSVESAIHQHRALHVHLVAHLQQTEVRTVECLLHRGDDVGRGLKLTYNTNCGDDLNPRQADAVMGDTLVDA